MHSKPKRHLGYIRGNQKKALQSFEMNKYSGETECLYQKINISPLDISQSPINRFLYIFDEVNKI